MKSYFGGTDITLDKIKQLMPTINVDGTEYKIENWLKECEVFDKLVINKSKVWIPYDVWERDFVKEVIWQKHNFKHYSFPEYAEDWWVYVPYCITNSGYYIYEITFYKNWKRKTQMKELLKRKAEPKRKFLSRKELHEKNKQL